MKRDSVKIIQKVFDYFQKAISGSPPARNYIKKLNFDMDQLKKAGVELGYNSAQFHHRQNSKLIKEAVSVNLLEENPTGGYRAWGKMGLIFPLRNEKNEIVNLYALKINQEERTDIFLNEEGLFPYYPSKETKSLVLTDSIIEACLFLQVPEVREEFSFLGLDNYKLTDTFLKAVQKISELKEIVLIQYPKKDLTELTEKLKQTFPEVQYSVIQLPDASDLHGLYITQTKDVISWLLKQRKPLVPGEVAPSQKSRPNFILESPGAILITDKPNQIGFITENANYTVLGSLKKELDSMRVTLLIENRENNRKSRKKLDLYEDSQVERICSEVSEKLYLRSDLLETDLMKLTDLLEEHRNQLLQEEEEPEPIVLSPEETKQCQEFLSQPDLLKRINQLIGKGGIVGEETNRLFLFIIASSYKMPEPLNAMIQGSSGSGKTHLLSKVLEFMPEEDVLTMTRVTDKSFYNFEEEYLNKKIIGLEDLDGLRDEAFLAFRELQSRGQLTSSVAFKDTDGGIRSKVKTVRGSIASISCTTKGEIYEDNMNRCFLVAVDESEKQTERIIDYQNKKSAGKINKEEQRKAQVFLQNCIRTLEPAEVINPFAEKIHLPREVYKIRRLNQLYQSFVKQITILHQFQRQRDKQGRVISDKEDLRLACDIMFDSILLKIDELDGSLRSFFESLKSYVKKQTKTISKEEKEKLKEESDNFPEYSFTQKEVRHAMRQSKSQLQRYINDLLELEYIRLINRNSKGFRYKIIHWDDVKNIKEKNRSYLYDQLANL